MINDNYKPINKDNLEGIVTKLKLVLNPNQWTYSDEINRIYFKLSTDLSSLEDIAVIVNGTTDSNKVILFNGYISNSVQNNITGINYGSQLIKCLGYYYENNLLQIVVGIENPDNLESTSEFVRKLLVEVLISSDTKNHCTEIIALDEFPDAQEYITTFAGETGNNWEYTIVGNLDSDPEGTDPRSLTIDPTFTSTIDKISKAQTADKLANNITFHISGENVEETSSVLDFNNDPTNVDLEVNVDTQDLKDYIDDQIDQKPVNPASTESIGGFRQYGGTGSPQKPNNWYAVNIDDTDDYNYAYVDLTNFQPSSEDEKHRYTDMSEAPEVAGTIVQYIGPSDDTYTKGYFYQFTPTDFDVVTSNQKWMFSIDSETTGTAITNYNFKVDYQITSGDLVFTMVPENSSENWEVSDDSIFIISQNSAELVRLTYGEIKSLFKIEIKLNYRTDPDNTLTLTLSIPAGAADWKQKNVQPMLKIGSPLVYKGTILATSGQTDIEALEANVPVEGRELGDFYIVRPSNQEYCWISEVLPTEVAHWEFMGEVVTVPTYTGGNHISITGSGSNYTISDSGLQETLIPGNNINISNKTISANGYTYDPTKHSFATGNCQATGEYSHAEGYVYSWPLTTQNVIASGKGAHAEGYAFNGEIIASGDGSHAEGWTSDIQHKHDIIAAGIGAHAEGIETLASDMGSHSEGCYTIAAGYGAHAEGSGEGEDFDYSIPGTFSWSTDSTTLLSSVSQSSYLSSGDIIYYADKNSFAQIIQVNDNVITIDKAFGSEASNVNLYKITSAALGSYSHTEGCYTRAFNEAEHAEGKCNVSHKAHTIYGNAGNTQHSIGIGADDETRKNAFEIMQNGDAYLYGVGNYDGTTLKASGNNIKTLLDVINNIPSAQVQSDWNLTDSTAADYIKNKPTIPASQVNADWNASTGVAQILNKPTIPTVNNGTFKINGNTTEVSSFSANSSNDSTVNITSGLGINIIPDSSTNTITIAEESHLHVVDKSLIITAQHGSTIYKLKVLCDLSGETVNAVNLTDFVSKDAVYLNPITFKWTKTAAQVDQYAGICFSKNCEGVYIFNIELNHSSGKKEIYKYGLILDTPGDATFTFVSTNNWPIICKGDVANNSLYAYLKIPDSFAGDVILTPMRCDEYTANAITGCFEGNSFSDGIPANQDARKWSNEKLSGTTYPISLSCYTSSTIHGSDVTLRVTSGNYLVDILLDDSDTFVVGMPISDNVVNDYFIHTISKLVNNLNLVGAIQMYAGSSAPTGWLMCDGSEISRTIYSDLFDVIGTTYGAGDGNDTFNLPNLLLKFPLCQGTGYALGSTGGSATHTLDVSEMPAHSHDLNYLDGDSGDHVTASTTSTGVTNVTVLDLATKTTTTDQIRYKASGPEYSVSAVGSSTYIANEGGTNGTTLPHNNMPPYLTVNFIIKY